MKTTALQRANIPAVWPFALIAAAVCAVYAKGLAGDLVRDNWPMAVQNEQLTSIRHLPSLLCQRRVAELVPAAAGHVFFPAALSRVPVTSRHGARPGPAEDQETGTTRMTLSMRRCSDHETEERFL